MSKNSETICGYVERITFQSEENGYTVAKLQEKRKRDLTCIVGTMPALQPGETVSCTGRWSTHPQHGSQFLVDSCKTEAPADLVGIQKYLGSGLIKGIGPKYAERIVACFQEKTLQVIDESPQRLKEVPGLGKKRIEKIASCWVEQKSIRTVMIFLQSHGVSPAYAQRIFKTYGQKSIELVQENPYLLAKDIFGIGFKTADHIARSLGIDEDSPRRIEAALEFILSEFSSQGHICYPEESLLKETARMLEVQESQVQECLETLAKEKRVVKAPLVHEGITTPFVWLRPLFLAEKGVVSEIERILMSPSRLRPVHEEKALDWAEKKLGLSLAENQKKAVAKSLKEKFHIITGGPGTGKSTITNAILQITGKLSGQIILAAPTGRAAKRMSEITGYKASTIHSLLSYDFKKRGFKKNRSNPLECDLIIVDEASMIDTLLMNSLLKAVPTHARIVLVGDIHQLPSVGPGNVLKDIIQAACVPVTQLTEIFRQAKGSQIITNAHRINRGDFPDLSNKPGSDFFFINCDESEEILKQILSLVAERLPVKFGLDRTKDIQVLAPMKRGVIGTENLNVHLQQTLNPQKNFLQRGGKKFCVQDKVMQIRNNYQKEVFNGDIGIITSIDDVEQQVLIRYEDKIVTYEVAEMDEVMHAYAVSIHKYQGSECPCIVMPIHTAHFKLLHRNLLYTGVTRGKKLVVLVGTKKATAIAVNNDEVKQRYTGLKQELIHKLLIPV